MKKLFCVLLMLFAADCLAIGGHGTITIHAQEITLQWDANTEPDLAGYKLYYKASDTGGAPYNGTGIIFDGQVVDSPIDVGNVTEVTVDVPDGQKIFFAVTAYDNEVPSLESDYSDEIYYASYLGRPPEVPKGLLKKITDAISQWFKQLILKIT